MNFNWPKPKIGIPTVRRPFEPFIDTQNIALREMLPGPLNGQRPIVLIVV